MAGLLDFGSEEERLAQQRALQAYADQVGKQQDRQAVWDALGQTLPAQIVKSIYQAARLPGDVYQGKVDPQSPEAIGRAADFAGAAITGSMPFAVRGALGSGGGKMVQPQAAEDALTLYHGSPHNFEKFDVSKIGTGEGAQAYGPGLYFAENEKVAKQYRDKLTSGTYETTAGRFDPYAELEHMNIRVASNKSIDNALERARGLLETQPENSALIMRDIARLEAAKQGNAQPAKGHMYEVAIKADRNSFMDYDKAFKDQPEAVRAALTPERLGLKPAGPFPGGNNYGWVDETGKPIGRVKSGSLPDSIFGPGDTTASIMRAIGRGDEKLGVERLRDAGVPGVRYLDDGSRGGTGSNTSNYVVFDDSMIDILRKYGLVGLLGGGAVAAGANAPKPIKREDIERGLL